MEALSRGVADFKAGRFAEACRHFEAAVALNPASTRARLLLGHAARAASAPSPLSLRLSRARADAAARRYGRAFREADALIASDGSPECYEAPIVIPPPADMPAALQALKAFAARHARSPWPVYCKIFLLSRMGRGNEALQLSRRLAEFGPRYAWMRWKRGELLMMDRRQYAEARREYEAAAAAAPRLDKIAVGLAELALCLRDEAEAERVMAGVLASAPAGRRAWAAAARGRFRLWAGRYEEALADLPEGLAGAGLRERGAALLLTGRAAEAAAAFDEVLARDPGDAEAWTWRGELRRLSGELDGALADLDAAIAARGGGNPFWALANRALAKAARGDAPGAWSDYQMIRRDVRDAFAARAGSVPADPSAVGPVTAALEAGLRLARGLRAPNEHLFPVWMGRDA